MLCRVRLGMAETKKPTEASQGKQVLTGASKETKENRLGAVVVGNETTEACKTSLALARNRKELRHQSKSTPAASRSAGSVG